MTTESVLMIGAVLVASTAAAWDARTGHIPNGLSLGTLAAAPVVAFALEAYAHGAAAGWNAVTKSLLGFLVCAIGPLFTFMRGGLGGGDVKLLAALGALLGPRLGLDAEVYGFVAGALVFLGILTWEGRLFATVKGCFAMLLNPFRKAEQRTARPAALSTRLRLGPSIAAGTLVAIGLHAAGA